MEDPNLPENRNINTGRGNYNERIEGDYIQGNVFQNIFNLGRQTTTPIGNPARPKNERILLAAVKEEVTARLRQSLHNAVLINLDKESQLQQVKRPWDAEIKIGLKPAVPLPNTTTILQVFDSQEIAGKLLILGAPGAGKTTTQLELAEALVKRAEEHPDYPVPVLFNLSSWKDDQQPLTDWLVAELKSKYGVSTKLGQEWVNNHQLLPLLDGLDELEPQRQELCVQAINQFLTGETRPLYLVVCSRSEEYNNYATQLQLNGAIYLQPLNTNQIHDYLRNINSLEILSIISNDLLELVKTPLLLAITVLVVKEMSVEERQHLNSTADPIQHLLNAYIGRMLTRDINGNAYFKNKPPTKKQTQLWLIWLSQQMQRESKTEFLIEEMQPFYLKDKIQKTVYKIITKAFLWGLSGLEFMLILILYLFLSVINNYQSTLQHLDSYIGLNKTFNFILITLTCLGIFYLCNRVIIEPVFQFLKLNLSLQINEKIKPIEIINYTWNRERFSYKINQKIIMGLVIGAILWWIDGLIYIIWLPIGIIITMGCFILCEGLYTPAIVKKEIPNQGILKSALNSGIILLIVIIVSGLIGHLLAETETVNKNQDIQLIISLLIPMFISVLAGLFGGGKAAIQHFTLRLILYHNGYIPWNYARFLDYCTERLFLQRVGGRYRFIHKLLQDHFAQMEFKRN